MEKTYEESIKNLTDEQRLELIFKLLGTLGYKRVRHEQKRNKHVLRFQDVQRPE